MAHAPIPNTSGLSPDLEVVTPPAAGWDSFHLTRSQRAAFEELQHAWTLRDAPVAAGLTVRRHRLLVGLSGSGKTALVREFARSQGVPLHAISVGSWVVAGAYDNERTLAGIANTLKTSATGIVILIDEVDKFSAAIAGGNGWHMGVLQEILALLDCDNRLCRHGFDAVSLAKLRRSLIVGAGAWQALQRDAATPAIGFGSDGGSTPAGGASALVTRSSGLNEELLTRFADDLLVVEPLSASEVRERIAELHSDLGLPAPGPEGLETEVNRMMGAGAAMRALEGYYCRLLRAHPEILDAATRPPAPVLPPALPAPLSMGSAAGPTALGSGRYPERTAASPGEHPWPGVRPHGAGRTPRPLIPPAADVPRRPSSVGMFRRRLVVSTPLFAPVLARLDGHAGRLQTIVTLEACQSFAAPVWLLRLLPCRWESDATSFLVVASWLDDLRGAVSRLRGRHPDLEDLMALREGDGKGVLRLVRAGRLAPPEVAPEIHGMHDALTQLEEIGSALGLPGGGEKDLS